MFDDFARGKNSQADAVRLTGNLLPATASILLYALLPRIVNFSRSEMPHTLSTLYVLSSLLFFCKGRTKSAAGGGLLTRIAHKLPTATAYKGQRMV